MELDFIKTLKLFLPATLFFLIMDFTWLNFIANQFYMRHMGHLLDIQQGAIRFNFVGAVGVYLILIFGLFFFVLNPATSLKEAIMLGALFGLVTYGTYDFTCHAVMKDWPYIVTVVDILWGIVLCGSTAGFTYWVAAFII